MFGLIQGLLLLISCGGSEDSDTVVVDPLVRQTQAGPVRGEPVGDLLVFRSIPYALAPEGDRRWRPPEPMSPWEGVRDALTYGPACWQLQGALGDPGEMSEDCLHLNVWTHGDDQTRPVMVWIHGGGMDIGRNSDPMFEGEVFTTDTDTVYVSINYRLGAWANLPTDLLDAEPDSTNLGIRDQVAALQWVQANIAAFGGDPDNVTLFGESAGGTSICALLASAEAEGLFHRGIIQSGGACHGLKDQEDAKADAAPIVEALGCTDAACLRGKTPQEILDAQSLIADDFGGMTPLNPTIDGSFLKGNYWDRLAAGQSPALPVMTGANADEMALFLLGVPTGLDAWNAFKDALGVDPEVLDALYPATTDAEAKEALIALQSDLVFICPALRFAEHGGAYTDVWMYLFDSHPEDLASLGAAHGLELFLLFDTFDGVMGDGPSALGAEMRTVWGGFAHSGGTQTVPGWAPYATDDPSIALFAEGTSVVEEIREGRCETLRSLGLVR